MGFLGIMHNIFIILKNKNIIKIIREELILKKIASFTINHDTLTEGIYTSRIDEMLR